MTVARILPALLAIVVWFGAPAVAGAQGRNAAFGLPDGPCDFEHGGGHGPYDYADPANHKTFDKIPIVEVAHFFKGMEDLKLPPGHNALLGSEFDYTLRAVPNHWRALNAMVKLAARDKTNQPKGSRYTVDCWFQRGLRYRPNDVQVRFVYGTYLARVHRNKEAVEQFGETLKLSPNNANTHYNLGLVYLDMKEFDKSLEHAHKAYGGGFALPGLRDRLKKAGKWSDIAPVAQKPAAPPATTSSSGQDSPAQGQ